MRAKILKIDKKLFDGEILKIVVPATGGEMCVLPHHMSIITCMRQGQLKLFTPAVDRPVLIEVESGIFSFSEEIATVML